MSTGLANKPVRHRQKQESFPKTNTKVADTMLAAPA
jgi:hypothetical protein